MIRIIIKLVLISSLILIFNVLDYRTKKIEVIDLTHKLELKILSNVNGITSRLSALSDLCSFMPCSLSNQKTVQNIFKKTEFFDENSINNYPINLTLMKQSQITSNRTIFQLGNHQFLISDPYRHPVTQEHILLFGISIYDISYNTTSTWLSFEILLNSIFPQIESLSYSVSNNDSIHIFDQKNSEQYPKLIVIKKQVFVPYTQESGFFINCEFNYTKNLIKNTILIISIISLYLFIKSITLRFFNAILANRTKRLILFFYKALVKENFLTERDITEFSIKTIIRLIRNKDLCLTQLKSQLKISIDNTRSKENKIIKLQKQLKKVKDQILIMSDDNQLCQNFKREISNNLKSLVEEIYQNINNLKNEPLNLTSSTKKNILQNLCLQTSLLKEAITKSQEHTCKLFNIISETIDIARPNALKNNITLKMKFLCQNEVITIDSLRIKRILLSMIHKSIEMSPHKSSITLSILKTENDQKICFHLRDESFEYESFNIKDVSTYYDYEVLTDQATNILLNEEGWIIEEERINKNSKITKLIINDKNGGLLCSRDNVIFMLDKTPANV